MSADPPPGRESTGSRLELEAATAEHTGRVGEALAEMLEPGDVVLLVGDLGAGKTTMTQGIAKALGVAEHVTSPTFTLLRSYECAPPAPGGPSTLLHADLFRLDQLKEVVDLALGEMLEEGAAAVVEWGDVARPVLGGDTLTVRISLGDDPATRVITFEPAGAWVSRRPRLEVLVSRVAPRA
jgi:tRNA threonylcarbamoyladenosine biosynthesis protein TsaE